VVVDFHQIRQRFGSRLQVRNGAEALGVHAKREEAAADQGCWIGRAALRGSRAGALPAAFVTAVGLKKKKAIVSVVCEMVHGLCQGSVFYVLQYHPLEWSCLSQRLGKEVGLGRSQLINLFSCPRTFYRVIT